MLFAYLPTIGLPEFIVFASCCLLIVWAAWRICEKAGFPGAMGLLSMVPVVNIGLILVLAFADWPALRHGKIDRLA
ncbi:hypothetical protein EP7_001737 [Isosphaeraceae bacterium EP7]